MAIAWTSARSSVLGSLPSLSSCSGNASIQSRFRQRMPLCVGEPRPRHALTKATRLDVERIAWPEGRPDRKPDLPASAPIHQLATLDLLAAFLRHADPLLAEGLVAWVPERACGQLFDGFLRPDALAVIRVQDRLIALFVERDLGSERGEALGEKIRRYRLVFARDPDVPINVGFVVESERRARTVHTQAEGRRGPAAGVTVLTAIDDRLRRDPLGGHRSDGNRARSTRNLSGVAAATALPLLAPGCLSDGDALAALDDRAALLLPALSPYLRP